jgi:predicted PurR-regulated permease PerM
MQYSSTQKSFAAWSLIAVVLATLVWLLSPILTPFIVAAVLAYALTPVVDWLDARGKGRVPRMLAVLLVEAVFILLVLAMFLLLVPIVAKQVPLIREQLPPLLDLLQSSVRDMLTHWGVNMALDFDSLKNFALKHLNSNVGDAFGSLMASLRVGGNLALSIIGNAVLIPLALFYFLMDWDRFVSHVKTLIPPRLRGKVDGFMDETDAVLGQYLRGQALVMLILAVYYSVGLSLFGLDLAIPIGVFTGLAIFVPYLGFGLGLVLATLAGLLEFTQLRGVGYTVLMVSVIYGFGQILESLYLTPRLVGERIGLHPLTVIFALLAFGQLFGFVGVLVALPVSAVLLVAIRHVRSSYLSSKLYKG